MARRLLDGCVRMSVGPPKITGARVGSASTPALARARSRSRAFTLVELAIVVTIVGVLAVIAVVGYRKLVLSAKVTEARNLVSAIRVAQEDYKVERGVYANLGPALCPLSTSGTTQTKTVWNPACSGGTNAWTLLPVHVDGPVQFGYATVANQGVAPPGSVGQPVAFVTVPAAVGTAPWYYVTASADLDAEGGAFTQLVGTSFSNQIFSANEGE